MARWCVQKTGCCTAKVGAIVFGILGVVFLLVATVLPPQVEKLIDSGLCASICIPNMNDPEYVYNNWVSNDNRTQWPPEYMKFWVYNITNTFDIEANGSTPILSLVGPITYLVHRYKFNVANNDDFSQASYETQELYELIPEMSNISETDMIYSINLPFVGSVSQIYQQTGMGCEMCFYCSIYPYQTGAANQTCLWNYRTVHETLWSQFSNIIDTSSAFFDGVPFLDSDFRLFNNNSNFKDAHEKKTSKTMFGMGGVCVETDGMVLGTFCNPPAMTGADIRHVQYTGRGSLDDVAKYILFFGNATINAWNRSVHSGELVSGTDHYQFAPWLDKANTLTIFDDLLMRHVDLTFLEEYERLGVTVWRYTVTDDLFSASDPFYFSDVTPKGMLSVSPSSAIVHGTGAPVFTSRMYMVGVDPAVKNQFQCSNCPNISNDAPYSDYGPVVDVEPTTGKTVGGFKRGQFNVRIGQQWIYNDTNLEDEDLIYAKVPDMYMPIFVFEDSSLFEQDQADQITDGLNQISFGQAVEKGAKIAGGVLTAVFFLLSFAFGYRWHQLQKEIQETWGDDAGEYTSAPSGVDGENSRERGINE